MSHCHARLTQRCSKQWVLAAGPAKEEAEEEGEPILCSAHVGSYVVDVHLAGFEGRGSGDAHVDQAELAQRL